LTLTYHISIQIPKAVLNLLASSSQMKTKKQVTECKTNPQNPTIVMNLKILHQQKKNMLFHHEQKMNYFYRNTRIPIRAILFKATTKTGSR
jgi:hypothetical protein